MVSAGDWDACNAVSQTIMARTRAMEDLPYAISQHKTGHRYPQEHASVEGTFIQSHEDRKEDEDGAKVLCDCTA